MKKDSKILICGGSGMVGSAIVRNLQSKGYTDILTPTHNGLDLMEKIEVSKYFDENEIEYVFLASAKVGGIKANSSYPASFIYNNIQIQTNVIHQCFESKIKKLLFLGSSCIYPRECEQPIKEEYLLNGKLEPTNEPYAIAKICGVKMCQAYTKQYDCNFISAMPTNLYGQGDNYDLETSHVLPALLRKFHDAKMLKSKNVELWGDGSAMREFLYVDDCADACVFLMNYYNSAEPINVGTGKDITIKDLAHFIKGFTGYEGGIYFNDSYPNGTPKKVLDVSKLKDLGWEYSIELDKGIKETYKYMLDES